MKHGTACYGDSRVTGVSETAAAVPPTGRGRRRLSLLAAVVLVIVAAAVWAFLHYEPSVSLERLLDLFEDYGYFVIFVPVMLETAGVPLPGETILLLSGVAASTGRIDPWIAIAVGSAAAIIGDNIGYAIGRYGGRRLVFWRRFEKTKLHAHDGGALPPSTPAL